MIAWIGSICLSLCAIPQLIAVWRTKDASGLSWGFLALWGLGELGLLVEVVQTGSYPLIANYCFNAVAVGLLIAAKAVWGRKHSAYHSSGVTTVTPEEIRLLADSEARSLGFADRFEAFDAMARGELDNTVAKSLFKSYWHLLGRYS